MPGAQGGGESDGIYVYYVAASVQEATDFYRAEMAKQGWELGGSGGNAQTIQSILIYRGNGSLVVIGINPSGQGAKVALSRH